MGEKNNQTEFEGAIRVKALESLLLEKGVIKEKDIDFSMGKIAEEWTDLPGRLVVARAWVDKAFKKRLLADARLAVMEEFGLEADVIVVENTETVHNLSVCSLCSCYPVLLLGFPPSWYKSSEYRARAVSEPRAVLREFGVELPENVEVRVFDSLAPPRHLVLPLRPPNTEGKSEVNLLILSPERCVWGWRDECP